MIPPELKISWESSLSEIIDSLKEYVFEFLYFDDEGYHPALRNKWTVRIQGGWAGVGISPKDAVLDALQRAKEDEDVSV